MVLVILWYGILSDDDHYVVFAGISTVIHIPFHELCNSAQCAEPTVAFFFVNYRDHKIQAWYILGSFKIDASWALKFFNKVDMVVTQEMCNEAVQSNPEVLAHVPAQFVIQEMYNEVVQSKPWCLQMSLPSL